MDLIDRQAAIDAVGSMLRRKFGVGGDLAEITIADLPSAEPQRKKGRWMKHEDRSCWYCSECHADNYFAYSWNSNTGTNEFQDNFCPNCGAEMTGGDASCTQ